MNRMNHLNVILIQTHKTYHGSLCEKCDSRWHVHHLEKQCVKAGGSGTLQELVMPGPSIIDRIIPIYGLHLWADQCVHCSVTPSNQHTLKNSSTIRTLFYWAEWRRMALGCVQLSCSAHWLSNLAPGLASPGPYEICMIDPNSGSMFDWYVSI